LNFSEGLAPVLVGDFETGKWGYIDSTGNMVIEPQFDNAYEFSDGIATVRIADKWGFIDMTGQHVIDPQFDDTWAFYGGIARVRIGNECGYIDLAGNYIWGPVEWPLEEDLSAM
jgi:serine/threonine-protein kinase